MSEFSDAVIDGIFCGQCGELIDGLAPGFPRLCEDCDDEETS